MIAQPDTARRPQPARQHVADSNGAEPYLAEVAPMTTETITTHDLRVGDVILSDGMILKIDQEPEQTRHPVDNDAAGVTLATRALIINWDALVERAQVDTYITGFIVGRVRDGMNRGAITKPRWTIQGNGLARWTRALGAVAR